MNRTISVIGISVLVSLAAAALALLMLLIVTPASASHLDEPPSPNEPIDDPIPGHVENGAIQLKMETLTEGNGLTAPNWGTFAPGQPLTLRHRGAARIDQEGYKKC